MVTVQSALRGEKKKKKEKQQMCRAGLPPRQKLLDILLTVNVGEAKRKLCIVLN